MRSHPFLPGIETAPGSHRVLVTNPEHGGAIEYHEAHPELDFANETESDLARKQRLAATLGPVVIDGTVPESHTEIGSWDALRDATNAWLEGHLAGLDFSDYDPAEFPTPEEARQNVIGAARQGVATIAAFLEVVSAVLAWRIDEPLAEPNTDIADWAAKSKGFIIEWLGVSEAIDYRLANALSTEPSIGPFTVFNDLHFEWIYFLADPEAKEVRLDPEMAPALTSNGVKVQDADTTGRPLFGCPARKMIPHIYDAMVRRATEAGLFGATYADVRARS